MNKTKRDTPAMVLGVFFLVLAVVVLLDELEVVNVRMVYVWPPLLILAGVVLVGAGFKNRGKRPPPDATGEQDATPGSN